MTPKVMQLTTTQRAILNNYGQVSILTKEEQELIRLELIKMLERPDDE